MHKRRSTWMGAVIGTIFALTFSLGAHAEDLREEFHQTYPLAANGQVSLANINGNVQVTAWDRNEVKVDAVKHASTAEKLQEAKIVVDTKTDSIAIKTEYPRDRRNYSNPASVDYMLTVPRNAKLHKIDLINGDLTIDGITNDIRANSINGKVNARGLTGRLDLSTVNGKVSASFVRLGANNVRLHSVNGPLEVVLPSDVQAEIHASTLNGSISNEYGLKISHRRFVGHDLRGKLGNGGTLVSLKNVNGSITVRHASDGKPLSKATSLGSPDTTEESKL
ncbi:MAG TPA: DUF4097 family beta strand repeat-containing protein [Terriglobales bacterium]|nr:DUF4097 family beta strand repeat-containing protein [Terriglobales bacterium]